MEGTQLGRRKCPLDGTYLPADVIVSSCPEDTPPGEVTTQDRRRQVVVDDSIIKCTGSWVCDLPALCNVSRPHNITPRMTEGFYFIPRSRREA